MTRMGGACSMHRQHNTCRRGGAAPGSSQNSRSERGARTTRPINSASREGRKYSRHSVPGALPDESICHLYPLADNYVKEDTGLRSPKTLAELCTETLCRSLAYLDGELPAGLPPDVVNDVVTSLVKHNAINATTLRVLKNCELGSLLLSGCRGVTDEWFEALNSSPSFSSSAASSPSSSAQLSAQCLLPVVDGRPVESMDLDSSHHQETPSEVFYNASHNHEEENHYGGHGSESRVEEESSCSTSSFVSASSTPYHAVPATTTAGGTPDHTITSEVSSSLSSSAAGHNNNNNNNMMHYSSPQQEYIMHYEAAADCRPPSITSNMTLLDLRGSQRLTDRGLIQLSDLGNLEVARLDNCYSIVGRGLLAFSISHRLHTLSLANCRRLTDEAIVNISHLNSLEALSLDGCRCITDRSLGALSGLFRLRKLDVSQCDLITDTGLEALQNLEEIEELSLGWCRLIGDNGVETLTRQPGRSSVLRMLSLARCSITDTGAEYLSRLGALEELDLNGCSEVGSAALGKAFAKMKNLASLDVSYCPGVLRTSWQGSIQSLKRLDLCYSAVRDSHLAKLTELPNLEELNFDSCLVGDWSIAHLADNSVVPNLVSLDLADTELTDLGMVHLAKFHKLKRLSLFYCNISNGGLKHLAKLRSLEVLNLDSREIGDEGLWHLRSLHQLKSLDIFSGRITDAGCSHIANITSLESLELCGGGVGDMGCAMLAGSLENLTSLNLSQNERITNRGAAALAALSNLKTLNLSNTRVTSAALVHFSDLMKLQSLALYGCRGIEEKSRGVNQLQNGLPGLKCIRINGKGSDEDGMIRRTGDDTEDDDSDDDDEDWESSSDDEDDDAHFEASSHNRMHV